MYNPPSVPAGTIPSSGPTPTEDSQQLVGDHGLHHQAQQPLLPSMPDSLYVYSDGVNAPDPHRPSVAGLESNMSERSGNYGQLPGSILSASSTAAVAAAAAGQVPAPSVSAACLACVSSMNPAPTFGLHSHPNHPVLSPELMPHVQRDKHLKCDGQRPCSRCIASGADASECHYIASRRGYKGPRRGTVPANPNKRRASSLEEETQQPPITPSGSVPDRCPMLLGATSTSTAAAMNHMALFTAPSIPAPNPTPIPMRMVNPIDAIRRSNLQQPTGASHMTLPERALESFYTHFHAAHPFVLPRPFLQRHIRTTGRKLEPLLAAMRYVGSLFLPETGSSPARASMLDEALRLCLRAPDQPRDGYLVQALLLVLVALDGNCEQDRARDLLAEAEQLGVSIGLHTREFAAVHGGGDPLVEESWRRTWWDLYVCDGMIAGVHRATQFLLYDVVADVQLPVCEEAEYAEGRVPAAPLSSLQDLDDQQFSGDKRTFTSFAYRVAAMRNLGRFMRMPPILFPEDENLARMQAHLTNWRLFLPAAKRDPIDDKSCAPDEMLFQAHFITTAITIMLHQPHSQLDASPARAITSCAPYKPVDSGNAYNIHTQHTITAAHAISKMLTYAVPLTQHTNFFTCVITMATIVHLSKWALYFVQDASDLREEIRLAIGALAKLSTTWKAAARAGAQVQGVAQEIYRAKKAQQMNPAFWVAFTQEEMMASLNVDEGVLSEIEILSAVTSAGQ